MIRFSFLKTDLSLARKSFEISVYRQLGRSIIVQPNGDKLFSNILRRELSTPALFCIEKNEPKPLFRYQMQHSLQICSMRSFSTKSYLFSNINDKDANVAEEDSGKPLTQRQKLTRIFAAYGTTAVVFHTSISLTSLGICYAIVSSGIDMVAILQKIGIASEAGLQSTFAAGASTFVVAYACHKVFMPVRIFLTVTCTPVIVRKLRSLGILKDKVVSQKG